MNYSYLQAEIKDIPTIRQLAYEAFADTYSDILSAHQIDYMLPMMYGEEQLRQHIVGNQPFFIVSYQGVPCGYFSIEPTDHQLFILQKIYLLPHYQGKGVGKEMVKSIVDITLSHCAHPTLQLFVNKRNPALGFYQKLGFEIIESRTTDIGSGYVMDDYIMQLNYPLFQQYTNSIR